MITAQNQSLLQQSDVLYERYGKPLEKTHRGRYIVISQEGKTLVADSVFDLELLSRVVYAGLTRRSALLVDHP